MPWSEPHEDDANPGAESPAFPDLASALKHYVLDGLSPELALDVTLNELVVRATSATQASAAALALARGVEMVCRATTGDHAPDLGVPLNTREGLSGACLHSRRPQLCHDTESDPRVDAAASRRLGVRSMLIVPAMDGDDLVGVLEVFSPHPGAFSESHQILLETFARDCARLRRFALELGEWPPEPPHPLKEEGSDVETRLAALPAPVPASGETSLEFSELRSPVDDSSLPTLASLPPPKLRSASDFWGLILGTLVIAAAAALSFLIGSRTGWLRSFSPPQTQSATPKAGASESANRANLATPPARQAGSPHSPSAAQPVPQSGGLVVYEHGKVVFHMKPPSSQTDAGQSANGSTKATSAAPAHVWLAPDAAEARLRHRGEPQYPAEALAAHRAGDIVLEVFVGEDGSVGSIRTVSGDPLLAGAAADAVRSWRYEPYRVQGRPAEFQTEVTLKFALPE
ncbi:MAG: TonB family protein [Terriglobales bacterium]